MNTLETNLTLWAICSILLFEVLFVICVCRCYFNRVKPKKFYLKREEYEYFKDFNSDAPARYQPTVLRAPHADELALIGTIRDSNNLPTFHSGIQNLAFYTNEDEHKLPPLSSSSSASQHWIDLQLPIINTAQLPPVDYDTQSYPIDHYPYTHTSFPRPSMIDFQPYHEDYTENDHDDVEDDDYHTDTYQCEYYRHSDLTPPQQPRVDTSTETDVINYSNIVPKSILKSSTNIMPPVEFLSGPYGQSQHSHSSSNYDETFLSSIKINTAPSSVPIHTSLSTVDQRFPSKSSSSSNPPKARMRFANVCQLNDVEWEVTRDFQSYVYGNKTYYPRREQTPTSVINTKISIKEQHEINHIETLYLSKGDILQQQAFEY